MAIKKIGNWAIETFRHPRTGKKRFSIVNEKTGIVDNPIVYDDCTVAYDFPERIPKKVKDYFERNAKKLKKVV